MKKTLLFKNSKNSNQFGSALKTFAAAGLITLFSSLTASAQWVVYEANEIPIDFTASPFKTSNVQPSITETSPAVVASEQSIINDPAVSGNKLLSFKINGEPHTSMMWRQDFVETPSKPTAATVVVRAKGMENVDRVLELDLEVGGFRETIFIMSNNTFTFNVVKGDLQNVSLPANFDVMQWHTYRVTKSNGTTTLYIDENNTPIATGTSATGARTQNYFRFGDGQSSASYGAHYDYIAWDESGAFSPTQKPLPSNLILAASKEMEKAGRLNVYPNPSTDRFSVTHAAARKGTTIEVYSANGIRVATYTTYAGATATNLDLTGNSKGLYTLVYSDGANRSTSRIVLQ